MTDKKQGRIVTADDKLDKLTKYVLRTLGQTGVDLRVPGKVNPRFKEVRWALWTIARLFLGYTYNDINTYFRVTKRCTPYAIKKVLTAFTGDSKGNVKQKDMLLIQVVMLCPWTTRDEMVELINDGINEIIGDPSDYKENIKALFEKSKLEQTPKIKLRF